MSVGYKAIQWSRPKIVYDAIAGAGVLAFLAIYVIVNRLIHTPPSGPSDEVLAISALGACAIALLHVVLAIGPLARLAPRTAPLLFNRRHLGVLTFLIALAHGVLSFGYYHAFGVISPLRSFLVSNTNFTSLRAFPFELLGAAALLIMFLLAATSHDFWLKNLSARTWKRLHFGVYIAYALLVGHVALGAMQDRTGVLTPILVLAGAAMLATLHLLAGAKELRRDRSLKAPTNGADGWIDAGTPDSIPLDRARIIDTATGERLAVFRHAGGVSCVTNVCAHQGGPLGEGRVIDGCITCPWHGWQYRPEDGCAPPPFVEKIATHQVRVVAGRVMVNPAALPAGTRVPPTSVGSGVQHG